MELGYYSNKVIITGLVKDSGGIIVGFRVRFLSSMSIPWSASVNLGTRVVVAGETLVMSRYDFEVLLSQTELNQKCLDSKNRVVTIDFYRNKNGGSSTTRFYIFDKGKSKNITGLEERSLSTLPDDVRKYISVSQEFRKKALSSLR